MSGIDQGWCVDDWYDEPWKDPLDGYEPSGEPDCWGCWTSASGTCWPCGGLPPLKERRRIARHVGHWLRGARKRIRHANDTQWQARNRPAFDDEAPF